MSHFIAEIDGFQEHQKDILLQVLNSKRLLIDHVEILEDCFEQITQTGSHSYFSAGKLAALGSIPIGCYFLPANTKWLYSVSTLIAAYGACCGIKCLNKYRYQRQRKQLAHFVDSLEQFEMAVKKNLLFLNESQHLRGVQDSLDKSGFEMDSFVGNCASCCIETVKLIHSAVKRLERECPLTERWNSLYAPIESLEDCELFSEGAVENARSSRAIKDYYNVFAYMQSQFLTRLVLSIACGLSNLDRCNLPELSSKLNDQKSLCLSPLTAILDTNRKRAPRVAVKSLPPELTHLRTLSLSLSAKLYSTVYRYNEIERVLDETVSGLVDNKEVGQLQDLAVSMEDVMNELSASTEECQRLLITMKKLTNKDDNESQLEIDARFTENSEHPLDMPPGADRVYCEQDKPCIKDEFFAVDGTEHDCLAEDDRRSVPTIDDLESINSKIVKRHFKPVLVQLRERIEPIGVEFKQRERQALKDKGIEMVDSDEEASDDEGSLDQVPVKRTVYGSDSEDDQEEDQRNAMKFEKSVQRYDDVRGFLAAKEQINIFGLKPMVSLVDEDVLE
ncbi:uncharacterized protein LOC115255932 [Aedes albopictus]|uniref:Vezatin n=1 Tax=Aedes albopictus TaxID=7160 RepID=A0ABM1ZGS2_AEDAL